MNKEDFINRLKELNISKKEFSEMTDIPYSTINNWGTSRSDNKILPVASWVESYLNYYEKAKKFDYIKNEVCGKC